MKNNKVKAEEVFGKVSDFRGAFGGAHPNTIPSEPAQSRTPRWHDSCFDGTERPEGGTALEEKDLCPHF